METGTLRHPRGGLYLRGLLGRPDLSPPPDPHRHPNGQHAVLEHDAEPAAAAYRRPFLRDRDRMGPAADEFPVHARADDRHFRQRHHGRHDHRQSRHDRRRVSRPRCSKATRFAPRRRFWPCAPPSRAPTPAWSSSGTARSSRTARWSPSAVAPPSCAGADPRCSPPEAADALAPHRARGRETARRGAAERRRRGRCRSRPGRAGGKGGGASRGGAVSQAGTRPRRRVGPLLIVRANALNSGETDADLDAVMAGAPDAILLPGSLGAASVQQLSAKLAVREADLAPGRRDRDHRRRRHGAVLV